MSKCVVCKGEISKLKSFGIPHDEKKKMKWVEICGKELRKSARICIKHFSSSDIITAGRRIILMPNAVPIVEDLEDDETNPVKRCNLFCALGCPSGYNIYKFPNRLHDEERRKYWFNFFDMEDPNIDDIYACERHFSRKQRIENGIRLDAVPDKHPESVSENTLFIRKQKMLPITTISPPKSQEQESEQDPLNIKEPVKNEEPHQSVETLQLQEQLELQIPLIQPIQFSKCTQTNTRLCGIVEVSDLADDYRLKCFYCCEVFPIEKWKKYLSHLTRNHENEEAFRIDKYVSNDHDYTSVGFNGNSPIENDNTPLLQPPSFATVVIEPNALLPLLVKPPVIPFETVNISSNYYPEENENEENCDKLLMPAPVAKPNLSSTPFTKKLQNKNKKMFNASTSTRNKSKQNSNITPLSRCLKRSNTIESLASITSEDTPKEEIEIQPHPTPPAAATTVESFEPKPTELVFEYAPKDIMNLLLDSMKNYPVLWEFDEQPFNEDYYEAVEEICKVINDKWSLKIDNLKMRRSINRILRFYCYLYPLENVENINEFTSYYDKLASFMPESIHDVAYARCSHCYKCFPNDYELKNHLLEEQNHNLGWPYKCVLCKECYTDSDDYEFHRGLQHYEEILRCKYCNRTFFQRNKYNHHVSVHQFGEGLLPGKHVCDICGKIFPTSSRLMGHKKYHGEKKHKCHLCSKSFYGNSLLMRHLKRHRNEFDLICEVCGKGFNYHNNLREHMKGHTGAKVTCNICNLRLRKSSLIRHLRTVHVACEGTVESTYRARTHHYRQILKPKPRQPRNRRTKSLNKKKYHCKICDIHFDGHQSIVEHNKEFHNDGTRYQCKICTSDFGKKLNLRVHYRRRHHLHVYQVYKLVNHDDDVEAVLSIKQEELDRLAETVGYSLCPPTKPTTTSTPVDDCNKSPIIKEDCTTDEISFGEERMHSDMIQDEIMKATDNIVISGNIKIDDDQYMNDLLKML
ncbi:uncharacterized protein ACRADG_009922 isoform 1-T1 [Cochliomyia hominivorax]